MLHFVCPFNNWQRSGLFLPFEYCESSSYITFIFIYISSFSSSKYFYLYVHNLWTAGRKQNYDFYFADKYSQTRIRSIISSRSAPYLGLQSRPLNPSQFKWKSNLISWGLLAFLNFLFLILTCEDMGEKAKIQQQFTRLPFCFVQQIETLERCTCLAPDSLGR